MAKRWCFTINNPIADESRDDNDRFWDNTPGSTSTEPFGVYMDYLVLQEERGEQGTLHWQGFLILKKKQKLAWMKKHLNKRAHWEIARGTNEQAANYCKKDETYTGGLRLELGKLPEKATIKKRDERLQDAAEELDIIKEGYKRPAEINSVTLMQCGFMPAYKELTADVLGDYRPDLKIVTLVGPPGTGKSYAIQHFFPEHGRCIYGNSGCWFQNPTAEVMIFEEFNGQIPLQRMLQFLDPYPLALEVKGRMAPAMYKTVIITSNTSPDMWYPISSKQAEDNADMVKKRKDAIHALYDRLGYGDGVFIPARTCGHYIEAPTYDAWTGQDYHEYIIECQQAFMRRLCEALDIPEPIEDDTPSQELIDAAAEFSIPSSQ